MKTSIELLLSELNNSFKKINNDIHTDDSFNIFSVLGVETREVIVCRFIGAFLNPNGNHNLGYLPLKLFMSNVLNENVAESELQNATVELEEKITGDRRVDIVIHLGNRVLPIEAKIWAGDQDAQLSDYYAYYKNGYEINKIFYLTPTGWEPSPESKLNLKVGKEIQLISFNKHITKWLEDIEKHSTGFVSECANQFGKVIETMCAKNSYIATIKDVLKLNEEFTINDNEMLHSAIKMLSYSDELLNEIRIKYLMKHIKRSNKYYLGLCEKDDTKNIDRHALLRVYSSDKNTPIALICVETNLYIVAQQVKSTELWVKGAKENYYWQYIKPNGYAKKKFPLKNLSEIEIKDEDVIEIEYLIDDIEI